MTVEVLMYRGGRVQDAGLPGKVKNSGSNLKDREFWNQC